MLLAQQCARSMRAVHVQPYAARVTRFRNLRQRIIEPDRRAARIGHKGHRPPAVRLHARKQGRNPVRDDPPLCVHIK